VHEPWDVFLEDGAAPGHGVEIYSRDEDLVRSVVTFLRAGLEADAPAILVATPPHAEAVLAELHGPVLVADASRTLASLREEGELSPDRFRDVIGGLLDEAAEIAPGAPRIFGEMVDLIAQDGATGEALELERLWEDLRRTRRFSLLCGYRLDIFDAETQRAPMPDICNAHSHVLPAHDLQRFNDAVARALNEVLGPATTRDVYYIVERPLRGQRVPVAQDALRWLVTSFPAEATAVLEAARGYYEPVEAA
jgi:hypothetical protein